MPNPSFNIFSATSPDLYQQQLALQQQQALAQQLMQQGSQPIDPMRQAGGFTVPISRTEGLAKIGHSLAGALMQKNINSQQGDLAQKQMQAMVTMLGGGAGGAQPQPLAAAGASQNPMSPEAAQPSVMAGSGSSVPPPQGTPTAMQAGQAPSTPNPLIAQLMKIQAAEAIGGSEGSKFVAAQMTPSDLAKKLQEAKEANVNIAPSEAYQHALTPDVPVRAGSTVLRGGRPYFTAPQGGIQTQWGAGGPTQSLVPGAQAASAGMISAKEQAESPWRFTPTTLASGATVPVSHETLHNGPPIPAPTAPQPKQQPVTPGGQPDPWQTMPRLEQPTGIGQSTYQHGRMQAAATHGAVLSDKLGQLADTANQRKSFNDQSLALLNTATTGPGAISITGVQNFLNSRLGVPEKVLQGARTGDPTATLELNKNLINAATQSAKANYGSRMTQSEVMMQIKQASPNVDMTTGAIRYLLNADNARAQYQIKQAADYGKFLQQGGDPFQFEGWYSKTFPMSASTVHTPNVVKDVVRSVDFSSLPSGR